MTQEDQLRSVQNSSMRPSKKEPAWGEFVVSVEGVEAENGLARPLKLVAFWLLAPTMLVILASLMVGHWYTLPKPASEDLRVRTALFELREDKDMGRWVGYHVLYSDCGCSRRVMDHLFSTNRPDDFTEKLLLVGHNDAFEKRALQAGFDLVVLRPRELKEQFSLESAPLFIVTNPRGSLDYVGGYTARKRGLAIRDLEIVHKLRSAHAVEELPLFGCAVSKGLQEILDPLGFKY